MFHKRLLHNEIANKYFRHVTAVTLHSSVGSAYSNNQSHMLSEAFSPSALPVPPGCASVVFWLEEKKDWTCIAL